jgi:hypothetical protein
MNSGAIEAAMLESPVHYRAKRIGFREVLNVGHHVRMPTGGLTASISAIQSDSAELRHVLLSLQTAKRTLLQSRERTVDLIMRIMRVDREVAQDMFVDNQRVPRKTAYQAVKGWSRSLGRCEGWTN